MRVATILRSVAAATTLFACAQAQAAFHLFSINEIYTNASGTLQFVEMTALAGGQQFTTGHTLIAAKGITLGSDLPGNTSGRRVLFGTAGIAAAFGVTPDYIIPDNFLSLGSGSINWGEGSSIFNYTSIPTDGTNSLSRAGEIVPGSPQNFAGVVGQLTTPPTASTTYQALWYAAPAESESGWGVNVTHQGDILFATWFTYDLDGSPMWLVVSRADKVSAGVYSGSLYRTTGPAFNAVPFNPSGVVAAPVGSATFNFISPTLGTFGYTVNGVSQTKNIVRQEFGTAPTCTAGGTAGATPNYQDLWWRSPAESESGWGMNIIHQGDIIFATWFTYAADGKGMWIVLSRGERSPGTQIFSGDLFTLRGNAFNSVPFNPATVAATKVGAATLTFTDASNGTFSYTVNSISQTKQITRQVFASPVSVCK